MSATPATIDITPLEQAFALERQDFDTRLYHIQSMTPELMRAKTLSDALIDQGEAEEWAQAVAEADTAAKTFLKAYAEDPEEQRVDRAIKDLMDARRAQKERVTGAATKLRAFCKVLNDARVLAVNQRAEQERRALEREQQRIAERDRAEEVARLKMLADAKAVEASMQSGGDKAEAEAESARLALAAQDKAAEAVIPAAVPASTFQPPKTGISGTKVFLRVIPGLGAAPTFLRWAAAQAVSVTIPREKRNVVILMLGGIEITVNFAGLRKSSAAIPGVEVTETIDSRNLRR